VTGRGAQWCPIEAGFAEELPLCQNPDDGFLAVLGQDGDLDLAFLDIKNAVGDLPLSEDFLIFPVFSDGFPRPRPGPEKLWD
jgi:hypothetical protein